LIGSAGPVIRASWWRRKPPNPRRFEERRKSYFRFIIRVLCRERFENLTAIARTVPVHLLRLSLKGEFWMEIERTP